MDVELSALRVQRSATAHFLDMLDKAHETAQGHPEHRQHPACH